MASGSVPRKGPNDDDASERGARVVPFPETRSFGPLRWRTIRIASLAVVILLLVGALFEIFLFKILRDPQPASADSSRIPGS